MGFRKMASSAFDWAKDIPNKAINAGMPHVNSEAILDKMQDTASYANTRLLERSISNGGTSASRLKSPLHRGARTAQNIAKNTSAGDIDQIARSAIGSATTGAVSGAVGGMVSEDQSVLGGALWGGALGGVAGGGVMANRILGKKNLPENITKTGGRLRDLRAKADKLDSNVPMQKTPWGQTKVKDIGKTWKRNSRIDDVAKRRSVKRSELGAQISKEEALLAKQGGGLTQPVKNVNPWLIGGGAGALTLAHSTLTANQPLPY